jgi:hypothetical protein
LERCTIRIYAGDNFNHPNAVNTSPVSSDKWKL